MTANHPADEKIPIIGVPAARSREESDGYVREQVGEPYIEAIAAAGGCPVLLPMSECENLLRRMISFVDGLVLPGGGDISPRLYGQEPMIALNVDESSDLFEMCLCRLAAESNIPLLGICRGAQVLNVALGGTLIQDISTELTTIVSHRQSASRDTCTHGVCVEEGSKLAQSLGVTRFRVNSLHHQAIDRLGRQLSVVARAEEDGIIEGIESSSHPFLMGVQFHPEEICETERPPAALMEALVAAARRRGQ